MGNKDSSLIENFRQIQDATAAIVKINHDQVAYITVIDLLKKYKHNLTYGKDENVKNAFRTVLNYYLTEEELEEMILGA